MAATLAPLFVLLQVPLSLTLRTPSSMRRPSGSLCGRWVEAAFQKGTVGSSISQSLGHVILAHPSHSCC
jgi:hypothetical protein